jgi:hypothetical protein
MHYTQIVAVYSDSHTESMNTICGKNLALLDVEAGGICGLILVTVGV